MKGYCMFHKNYREISGIQTMKLANGRLVHQGNCRDCGNKIVKLLKDSDVDIVENGRRIPKVIFVGENTPKRLALVEKERVEAAERKEKEKVDDGKSRIR